MVGKLTAVAAVAIALGAGAASASAYSVHFFRSPDNNIGCAMVKGRHGEARCDILRHSWKPPPKPPSCPVDWGYGLSVGVKGRGGFFCAGDSAFDPTSRHLLVGDSIRYGRFRCTSLPGDGMRCLNRGSGHGFDLSRTVARRF